VTEGNSQQTHFLFGPKRNNYIHNYKQKAFVRTVFANIIIIIAAAVIIIINGEAETGDYDQKKKFTFGTIDR